MFVIEVKAFCTVRRIGELDWSRTGTGDIGDIGDIRDIRDVKILSACVACTWWSNRNATSSQSRLPVFQL